MRSVARERHYISASIRRVVIKMTSRCGLGWRDCDGFYALRSEESEGEKERTIIKKKKGRRGRIKFSQRQLTIVKSRPLPLPIILPLPRDATVDGPALPTLHCLRQNNSPSSHPPISHPRLGNVR